MKIRHWLTFLLLLISPLLAANKTAPAPSAPAPVPAQAPAPAPAPATTPLASPDITTVSTSSGPVFVIPLHGEVSPAQFYFLRRALKEAQRANAGAVILDVDTFGGRVDSAMEEMDALLTTRIPTIAFVNTKAISAGSLISLAAKRIYMHPNALIGASAVVGGEGKDLNETMKEKSTSMVVAKARSAANANGHPEDVAEAFVRKESEVKRGDVSLDTKDTLLTLNTADASKLYNGQPLLAAGTAENLESLLKSAGLTGIVRRVEPSGFEAIAFWITTLAPLLLIGGIAGAYIEMKAPGFGIPGIISLICFTLFFGGHFIAGLAGWEVIVVFVIGLALIISEIFIHPGTIIPGLVGVLLMLGSLVWAMVDYWPGAPSLPAREEFERPMANIIIALVGGSIAIALLAKYLPKIPLFNRLILSTASAEGPAVSIPMANLTVQAGDIGTATTTLRPAGKAIFGAVVHDVITNGDFIDAGTKVRVASTDGMRVVVDAAS